MARTTRIAIIGGGIGGLTAAHALSRRGFEVAVYEAAPELKEIGAGVALGPNAMKALRSLELEDAVRAVAGRSNGQMLCNWKTARVISQMDPAAQAEHFGAAACTVHRADLLDVLAASLPAGIVTLGARCVGVEPDGDARHAPASRTALRSRPISSSGPTGSTPPCGRRCSGRTHHGSPARSATAA